MTGSASRGRREEKERGRIRSKLQWNFEEREIGKSCLLVRQVTPNDHDTTTRGNDGTWSSDE
jgi:hypothetical protein